MISDYTYIFMRNIYKYMYLFVKFLIFVFVKDFHKISMVLCVFHPSDI